MLRPGRCATSGEHTGGGARGVQSRKGASATGVWMGVANMKTQPACVPALNRAFRSMFTQGAAREHRIIELRRVSFAPRQGDYIR